MKDEKISCRHCGSFDVVKKGVRKLASGKRQIYLCKDCSHRFSNGLNKKRFNAWLIVDAVCSYNNGYSYEEVCELISRKYKINIGKSSIERWVKQYNLGYLDIRDKIVWKYGKKLIVERMFNHSGLVYNFKLHRGKLREYGKFIGLKNFISDVSKGIDDRIFNGNGERCSQSKGNIYVNTKKTFRSFLVPKKCFKHFLCVNGSENQRLNKVIGEMLKIVKDNHSRHSLVENLMLCCDRDTLAVEVPVWYWDRKFNKGICGHIDVIQVKFGKIWILDYKPHAEKENFEKVVSQLYNYALAVYFRTGVLLTEIKCGWFDCVKTFSFNPLEVKVR